MTWLRDHRCTVSAFESPPGPAREEVQSLKLINKTSCKVSTDFYIFSLPIFFSFCKMTAEYIYKDILHALVNYFQTHFIFSVMLDSCLKIDFYAQKRKIMKSYEVIIHKI